MKKGGQSVKEVYGVWVALATPFRSQKLDTQGLEKLLNYQIKSGVDGIVALGTTGEGPTLEFSERSEIISQCIQITSKVGKSVIAGCGSNDTRTAIQYCQQASEQGCIAALVITPYYNKPTEEGLTQHFLKIAEESPIPLILYHCPGRTGVSFTLETLSKLFEHPNIIGMKEATGNHTHWLALVERFKTQSLLAGDDDMLATFSAMGGKGIISATANVAPKAFVQLWDYIQKKEWEAAFDLQIQLLPLVRAVFLETNPGPVKYALSRLGLIENSLRLPLVTVKKETERAIDQALDALSKKELL